MFPRTLFTALMILTLSAGTFAADPKDDVQAAAKKTADSTNYTWTSTTDSTFGQTTNNGKTEKNGFTSLKLTMFDQEYPAAMKGEKAVIKTSAGWKTAPKSPPLPPPKAHQPDNFAASIIQNSPLPAARRSQSIADKLEEKVTKAEDAYSADLSADAAKELLSFRRPANAPPAAPQFDVKNAKGSIKYWLKDGAVTKMQIHLTGTVSFGGNDNDTERTTTTEIKDVGATKVEIPEEAKTKLAT